jgi:hypothetical protein
MKECVHGDNYINGLGNWPWPARSLLVEPSPIHGLIILLKSMVLTNYLSVVRVNTFCSSMCMSTHIKDVSPLTHPIQELRMGKIFSRNCLHFLVTCHYSDSWNIFLPWRLLALNGVAIFTQSPQDQTGIWGSSGGLVKVNPSRSIRSYDHKCCREHS